MEYQNTDIINITQDNLNPSHKRKIIDSLCGRPIRWDGNPLKGDSVVLEIPYQYTHYHFSLKNQLIVPNSPDRSSAQYRVTAIKKILERINVRRNPLH